MWRLRGMEPSCLYGGMESYLAMPRDCRPWAFYSFSRDYPISQCPNSFNRQFDDVAGLEPAAGFFGSQFQNAAGAHRSGTDDIPRFQFRVAAGMSQNLRPSPVHRSGIAVGKLPAIDGCRHLQVQPAIAIGIA